MQGRSIRDLEQFGKCRRLLCKISPTRQERTNANGGLDELEPEILPVSRASAWDFCLCKYTVDPTIVWLLQASKRLQRFPQVRSDSGPASISSPTLTMQLAPSSMFVSPLLTRHTASDCQMNLQKKMKSVWCQLQ